MLCDFAGFARIVLINSTTRGELNKLIFGIMLKFMLGKNTNISYPPSVKLINVVAKDLSALPEFHVTSSTSLHAVRQV